MSNTREMARRDRWVRRRLRDYPSELPHEGYSEYDYYDSTIHEIRKGASEKRYLDFKSSRPKAAELLELMFGDVAKEVFEYLPPDLSEIKCALLASCLVPIAKTEEDRISMLDNTAFEEL